MTAAPGALAPSAARGRLLIVLASVLWSTSGAFTNVLREPTPLGLHAPRLSPLQIAAGRVLCAALVLAPLVRRRDLVFRAATFWTALCFAAMNALFITALALGSAANAILLQYTAPFWLFLAGVWVFGEPPTRRSVGSLAVALAGVGVLLAGGLAGGGDRLPVLLGLLSAFFYAGVLLGLRAQRDASPVWLTVVNHAAAGVALLPFVCAGEPPTPAQLAWLALFGTLQMGLPYALMARGLRSVGPQEAGMLTLLEPVLNPLWAYLVAPDKEKPTPFLLAGGALLLAALACRYWPARRPAAA
jgi:drug/metabolite transporter (DMT)-like permease